MVRELTDTLVRSSGIEKFFLNYGITHEEVDSVRAFRTNAQRIEATVDLFKEKRLPTFSALEISSVVFYPESDFDVIKKRGHAALSYMFRKNPIPAELNLPFAQYLRLATRQTNTNMHELLGYLIIEDESLPLEDRLKKVSEPVYQFKPSHEDWYRNISLPYPIDEIASFGLGIIWRRGAVMKYDPPELTTLIYGDKDQKKFLVGKVRKTLQKMFGISFIMDENEERVTYPKDVEAEYHGIKLRIKSMAIGSFLTKTAGLPIGEIYSSSRRNLPKIDYDESAFLDGYKYLMSSSRNRWYAVTPELAAKLSDLLNNRGINAKVNGKTCEHCHIIEIYDSAYR